MFPLEIATDRNFRRCREMELNGWQLEGGSRECFDVREKSIVCDSAVSQYIFREHKIPSFTFKNRFDSHQFSNAGKGVLY